MKTNLITNSAVETQTEKPRSPWLIEEELYSLRIGASMEPQEGLIITKTLHTTYPVVYRVTFEGVAVDLFCPGYNPNDGTIFDHREILRKIRTRWVSGEYAQSREMAMLIEKANHDLLPTGLAVSYENHEKYEYVHVVLNGKRVHLASGENGEASAALEEALAWVRRMTTPGKTWTVLVEDNSPFGKVGGVVMQYHPTQEEAEKALPEVAAQTGRRAFLGEYPNNAITTTEA